MTRLSLLVGILGVLVAKTASVFLRRHSADADLRFHWLLGIAAIFPAWLIAFLALLPSITKEMIDTPLPPPAIFSSGTALIGIILTEYAQRRLQKSARGYTAVSYWLLGLISLLPAWTIALINLR